MKKTTKRPSKKSFPVENGNASPSHPQPGDGGERTVKKVKLSKALTIPDGTTVTDACRRMAARRVDAVLLTDSSALLSGILTDKDVTTRVVAEGLSPDVTTVSKVMTRNPIFVTSDTLAIDALQKMIQGKFRHLPVVENGEVIAILDITKCLYDAIARVEKASQQGGSIAAAAVDGVEHQRATNNFIDTLRERMFKPSLATILGENTKVAISSASDPVNVAAKRMQDLRVSSSVIVTENKIQGILTSKDILMRVMAPNLSPDTTLVEKVVMVLFSEVMTPNPQCASPETTIIDALHMMHDGKFLHLPVLDKDGNVVACVDVLHISHAAISLVENSSSGNANNDVAGTIMQKFWDSAFSLEPPEDYDTNSEISGQLTLDGADTTKSTYQSAGSEHQEELVSAVMQRIGATNDGERPILMYEDDEGDKISIATNNDLAAAVSYARSAGLKALKLNLKFADSAKQTQSNTGTATEQKTSVVSYRTGIFAGAVAIASIGILVYLKRANQ
ncbi:hypothetical protein TSUD_303560 [Trifolium subterraneum]|uniref:CBS domain-containing protein n=1 Tax=Trifolium subterraneum TaxID=3900 RepID=A0A2Z6LNT7_TRISU|nr:hypothetical protein TSUD_303560 [Trifolium subterraneum]